MNVAVDEYGMPILFMAEQAHKKRLKGLEAQKANILAAISLSKTLSTSLGPKGMDKIICSPDGDVTVTNDGATILSKMEVDHPCAKLFVELSTSQDDEIGDGTTGVVILAGRLLEQALMLIEKGLHPLQVADGYAHAEKIAVETLEKLAQEKRISADNTEPLVSAAITALSSKIVNSCQRHLAEIAVQAVLSVADLERRDVDFDLIKVEGKTGKKLEESTLVQGIVLDKEFSHPQMPTELHDVKIALLTCPFEPPKPKTKHKLDISTVKDYKALQEAEQNYFRSMVDMVKASGATLALCQWGFDDEANHLLYQNNLPAVRWIGGVELELIAIATGSRIVSRFEDLTPEKLGSASRVRQVPIGTGENNMLFIEGSKNSKTVTVLVHGGNQMVVEEAKRSLHDAICCVRNLVKSPYVVPGGGASEIAASVKVEEAATRVADVRSYAVRAYANALSAIAECLADNCGLNAVSTVQEIRAAHLRGDHYTGLDCIACAPGHMMDQNIWETLISKRNQISLATQVVRMILKIDDVISPDALDD